MDTAREIPGWQRVVMIGAPLLHGNPGLRMLVGGRGRRRTLAVEVCWLRVAAPLLVSGVALGIGHVAPPGPARQRHARNRFLAVSESSAFAPA
jgi:hypothetical protein